MSFVARLWNAIRNPVRYVGRDLHGNKFYESYSPNGCRTKRTVQYQKDEDMWKYVGGQRRLAVQWSAWLTHTRRDPPTIQELEADVLRQQRVLANVALIEARDRAESEQMLRIRQQDAARALEEAAAKHNTVPLVREPESVSSGGNVEQASTYRNLPPQQLDGAAPSFASASASTSTSTPPPARSTIKVVPPKFVTPASPRKSRTSAKFTLPLSSSESNDQERLSSRESLPEHSLEANFEAKRKEEAVTTQSPPPMPSRPVSETESWTPKARRRG
ncbi:hypothetical protein JR316_0009013 [Psilocybe cubensis]|uniref:Uncharacterized protein n=1 Tax=Psilocybe cubensis TaxID=181762 RepID=A0ACB8GTJ2_PSICU|nr:hypothetical protein JR316_0009013 [Psilocybe cubensis]KAH9478556.1 hypothetical protein JR316_0009013 [Psilocybe cubensis]